MEEADTDTDAGSDTKGLAVVLLLSVEPLVTSIVNFGLAYISDDEVRALLNPSAETQTGACGMGKRSERLSGNERAGRRTL